MRTLEGESLETHKRAIATAAGLADRLRAKEAGQPEGKVEVKSFPDKTQQFGFDVHAIVNATIDDQDVEVEFKGIRRTAHSLNSHGSTLIRYMVTVKVHKWQHCPIIREKDSKMDLNRVIAAIVSEVDEAKAKNESREAAQKLATKSQATIDSLKTAAEQAGTKIGNKYVSISQTKMRDTPFTLELRYLTEQQLRSVLATLIERHPS